MNFEKYIIDEGDFDFYMSLPNDERLLFIHDLICSDAYGTGSTIQELDIEPTLITESEFSDLIKDFESKMTALVDSSLSDDHPVNVLIINGTIIAQSDNLTELQLTISEFIMDGYLLEKFNMTPESRRVFQRREFCMMYKVIGKSDPLFEN